MYCYSEFIKCKKEEMNDEIIFQYVLLFILSGKVQEISKTEKQM